jgi:hypothetical protein
MRRSGKPKRLYEIDNDGFRRPCATASGGRSGLSALWAALQSSVEDRMTFDNHWTLADSRRFRFGLAAASKAGYRSSINPAAGH